MADAIASLSRPTPPLQALHARANRAEPSLRLHSRRHLPPLHLLSTTAGRKRRPASTPRPFLSCSCSVGTPTAARPQKRPPSTKSPVASEGRDEDAALPVCPGCGIIMQDADPNLPGYYQKRAPQEELSGESLGDLEALEEDDLDELFEDEEVGSDGSSSKSELDGDFLIGEGGIEDEGFVGSASDWDMEDWEEEEEEEDGRRREELESFAPAGVGYGNITEETLGRKKREKLSKSEKKKKAREEARRAEVGGGGGAAIVCARCHSLRNYGRVKNHKADNLIPDFDFDRLVAARLIRPSSTSPVAVIVVDCADFDGSFPKRAAQSLFRALEGSKAKLTRLPKIVLVATKMDLLPSQISPVRLDRWVRNRAKAGGAPKLSGVYLVSARKDLGVRNLLSFVKELAGPRGNVWVIGAQNAGKSTLINTFAKKQGAKITRLTEAAVPGTTLGILRIGGILPAKAKLYDTPGLLHPNLMTMRLNREEQKMVEVRKELQPRTYRMKAGQTVHVGGLTRLDLPQSSVDTIYVTIWASPDVSLHLGKTENAEEIWKNHVGVRLQPPTGQDRASELGRWTQRAVKISGISWEVNSIDIAVAGLGWFSFGLKGEATLILWIYDGVEITQREPLVLDRAPFLERPGFLLPKAISDAIGKQSKLEAEARKLKDDEAGSLSAASL